MTQENILNILTVRHAVIQVHSESFTFITPARKNGASKQNEIQTKAINL